MHYENYIHTGLNGLRRKQSDGNIYHTLWIFFAYLMRFHNHIYEDSNSFDIKNLMS